MELVATVNGIRVYSDKELQNVSNTRLEFSDGSWCDVRTRQVVNKGRGSISIGATPEGESASSETKTWGPERYSASALQIDGIVADVTIEPTDGDEIIVEMTGPEKDIDNIRVSEQSGMIVIGGSSSGRSRSRNVSISNISICNGNISIGGRGSQVIIRDSSPSENTTKVVVKVPKRTRLILDHIFGNVRVGDTEGNLELNLREIWNAQIGHVNDARLRIRGTGSVIVARVNSNLNAKVSGAGDIRVTEVHADTAELRVSGTGGILLNSGAIDEMEARVSGVGNVYFGGCARKANLRVSGIGSIHVEQVIERPRKRVSGIGSINIRKVG